MVMICCYMVLPKHVLCTPVNLNQGVPSQFILDVLLHNSLSEHEGKTEKQRKREYTPISHNLTNIKIMITYCRLWVGFSLCHWDNSGTFGHGSTLRLGVAMDILGAVGCWVAPMDLTCFSGEFHMRSIRLGSGEFCGFLLFVIFNSTWHHFVFNTKLASMVTISYLLPYEIVLS